MINYLCNISGQQHRVMKKTSKEQYPKVYLYRRIVQAKLFIDEHYSDSIDLDNISDEACFSKFHFIRLFKKIYAKTPHQYLTSVRIEKAAVMLSDGNSVTETCYAVGFDSASSFSGLFRKITGSSPSDFYMAQQQLKKEIANTPLKFVPSCFAFQHGWTKNSNFEEATL